ncbi:MAG TPA: hypothetical protein VI306_01265 [Pyrinomonadaceae bacterium]
MIIEEIQLHHWVRSNEREAQGIIPELVGRLVAASVRKPNDIRFPRADSIGQSGEDGYLDTDTGFLPFVPAGKSFWEIGTGANPAAKANSDYSNRTGATTEKTRQESTLVIVTPSSAVHAWTSDAQKNWRTKKLNRKEWRDVRVLDGTHLIHWLSGFPAVERWLAIKMRLPADAIEIPEERWIELSRIGSPPSLTPSLFVANRAQACAKLDEIFRGTSGLLKIDTHFPRHMADLVAAHLAHMDEPIRNEIAGRCLIITRPDAWSTLTSLRDHHVFIADFDIDDTDTAGMRLIERAKLQGHAVVFAGNAGGIPHPNRVSIPEPTNQQVIEGLKKAGYNEERARTLAMKSTGSLSSLLRCLRNLSSIPEWAQGNESAELRIAEMLGAWDENVDGDRQVAEELSGKAYEEWIGTIREIARRPASPVKQKNGIWVFLSRYEGWDSLGPLIFNGDLKRFQDLVVRIFRERDAALELAPEERYMATIRGKTPGYSHLLRTGLAETLALLGSRPEVISNSSNAEAIARTSVYKILKDADWELWVSLNDVLPLLAEAAPNEFLEAVDQSLQSNTFQAVFAQERRGFTGRTYMTGLLWALETLAWSGDYLSQVVLVLGELAVIDPGGNWANRPANSLGTILLPWFPQTVANVEKRLAAVIALMSEQPQVAWDLILSLLPHMHQTSSMTRKPAWRKMIPDEWAEGSTAKEYWKQINAYAKLAVGAASNDLRRLQTLIDKMNILPIESRGELLTHLRSETITALPEDERLPIWKELTDLIATHRRFHKADWAMSSETIETLSEIANGIAPLSPSHSNQRLFTTRDFDLYEETDNYEEEARKLDQRRQQAIKEVYSCGGLTTVLDFCQLVESPAHVGIAFAAFASVDDQKQILPELLESTDGALAKFAGGFVWSKFRLAGWTWVDALNSATWTNSERAQLLAYLPFAPPTWNRAVTLLGQEESLYWSKANVNPFDAEAEIGTAVDRLLEIGRVRESIFCMSRQVFKKQPINVEQAIRALRAVAESYDQFGNIDAFEIVQIVKALQESSMADPSAVASMEWSLLPLLDRTNSASPKFLERRLADEPAFFCEVIRLIFRSTKANGASTTRTAQDPAIAKNAYRLVSEWRTPPGSRADGSFDGATLKAWVAKVKASCEESGHLVVALQRTGHVLRYSPPDPDGLWIHHSVAQILNAKDASEIRKGFEIELFSSRGAHFVDPQGGPERELAKLYRKQAEEVELRGYARLAATLKQTAVSYDREAEHNIVTAHIESEILQD